MSNKKNYLFIMRHAKSDHPVDGTKDFDRTLNRQGQHESDSIAQQFMSKSLYFDLAVVSPSQRTTETYNLLAYKLHNPPLPLFDNKLYNAEIDDLFDILNEHVKENQNVLLVGHNPSVSLLCSFLTNQNHELGTAYLALLKSKSSNIRNSLTAGGFDLDEILRP